jgi:hypothetical protein
MDFDKWTRDRKHVPPQTDYIPTHRSTDDHIKSKTPITPLEVLTLLFQVHGQGSERLSDAASAFEAYAPQDTEEEVPRKRSKLKRKK